ncbi:MFS transporter, partial [Bordetella pertussis]
MSAPPTQDPEITTTTQESPHSRRDLLRAMAGVSATVVLVAFDSTIVTTTLPRVAAALNGMALYAWVGTAYLLATAASILIFGRLGDMYGRKPLMLVSVSLVALGSIACGLAQSMPQLIAFRTLQGIGGGMMIATAFAAPADLFPDAGQRVRWMALVSATFAMASGIGPVLGGAATQALGWRAAFFISPLAAVAALFLLARYFPRIRPAQTAS